MNKELLIKLRSERQRLLKIAKKQKEAEVNLQKAKEEERKLKRDIAILKQKTNNSLTRKIRKFAKNPKNRERLRKNKVALKRLWCDFQKFAKKYGY